jgi:hypothetical protein
VFIIRRVSRPVTGDDLPRDTKGRLGTVPAAFSAQPLAEDLGMGWRGWCNAARRPGQSCSVPLDALINWAHVSMTG